MRNACNCLHRDEHSHYFAYSMRLAWTATTVLTSPLLACAPVIIWFFWTGVVHNRQIPLSLPVICELLRDFAGNAESVLTVQWLIHWLGVVSAVMHLTARKSPRWHTSVATLTCICCMCVAVGYSSFFRSFVTALALLILLSTILVFRRACVYRLNRADSIVPSDSLPACSARTLLPLPASTFNGAWFLWTVGALYSALTFLRPICYDEMFTAAHYARLGPVFCLLRYDFPNNHPLYSLLSSLFVAPWADFRLIRVISLAAGILTIPAVYSLASRWIPARIAQAATVWFALHPLSLKYATEGRGYSLAICLSVWGLLLLFPANRENRPLTIVIGAWCLGIATLVVPSWLLLQGAAVVVTGLAYGWRPQVRIWAPIVGFQAVFGSGLALFLVAFWRYTFFAQMASEGLLEGAVSRVCRLAAYLVFADGSSFLLGGLALLAVASGTVLLWRRGGQAGVALAQAGTMLLAVLVLVVGLKSSRAAVLRQSMQALPFVAVIVGIAASLVTQVVPRTRYLPAGFAIILLCVSFANYSWSKQLELEWRGDYGRIAESYLANRRDGDRLEMSAPDSAKVLAHLPAAALGTTFDSMLIRLSSHRADARVWYLVSEVLPHSDWQSTDPHDLKLEVGLEGSRRQAHGQDVFSSGILRLILTEGKAAGEN